MQEKNWELSPEVREKAQAKLTELHEFCDRHDIPYVCVLQSYATEEGNDQVHSGYVLLKGRSTNQQLLNMIVTVHMKNLLAGVLEKVEDNG